jgi:hypothetical protein
MLLDYRKTKRPAANADRHTLARYKRPRIGNACKDLGGFPARASGEIIQANVDPSHTSSTDAYWEELSQGQTGKLAISFYVKSVTEPTSEPLEVKIVVVDQLAKQHALPPIMLKRRG